MNRSSSNPDESSFFQEIRRYEELGAFNDRLGQILLRAWDHGVQDEVTRRLISDKLRPFQKREAAGELPPFKAARLSNGDLILGKGLYGELIRILLQWLAAGVLVVSNTGGGKSNLVCFLLLQVVGHGCPVWMSESYKQHLRHLRRLFRRIGIDLIIVQPKEWRWNLLQSHLRDPRTHLATAIDLLVRVLNLETPRARSILAQLSHALYEKYGVWTGHTQPSAWPTVFDLYEAVFAARALNAAAREAILDRLGSLLVGLTPRCAAYRVAWNPADLARFSIDFEMRGATEPAKQILLESCLLTVFHREVERGIVNGPLKLVIAFDDSQRFFQSGNQSDGGEISPLDELAGVTRGTGISLWVILQTLQGLSRRLLPNLATKISGRLGTSHDYTNLGADLAMTTEQIAWARLRLQPGSFIGQVAEGNYREPFVFDVPLISFPEHVDDTEVAESVNALASLPTVFAEEFAHWQPHHVAELAGTPESPPDLLSEAERRFLKSVVDHPGKPSSHYAKLATVGGRQAVQIRQRLVRLGFLREHQIATAKRGRHAIVLEPLQAAFELFNPSRGVS